MFENEIFSKYAHDTSDLLQSKEWHAFRYPKMFDVCGLKDIHIYPMAHIISYIDTQYLLEYRKLLVKEELSEEIEWIKDRYSSKRDIYNQHGFSDSDFKELISLLENKADYLANDLETDKSYEWHGGFNFIVTGIK